MRIVLAELEDLPRLMPLYASCTSAMRANGNEQWGDDYPTAAIIRKDIEAPVCMWLGDAEADAGMPASAICLNEEQAEQYKTLRWAGPERALVVHRLCVDPARQRTGIAQQMMDFAEERARQLGYASIRLDTYSGNPAALRLYEQRGYRKTGEVFFRGRALPFFCFEKLFAADAAATRCLAAKGRVANRGLFVNMHCPKKNSA